jgi:hypothetical protein
MNIGDKIFGFKFPSLDNSANLSYNPQMDKYIGIEEILTKIVKEYKKTSSLLTL